GHVVVRCLFALSQLTCTHGVLLRIIEWKILLDREITDEPTGRQNQPHYKYQGGDDTGNNQMNRVEFADVFGIALTLAHSDNPPGHCLERLEEVQLALGKLLDVVGHAISRPKTRHARRTRPSVQSR